MKPGEIILLENTRYEDVPSKLESGNDVQLAMYWAELADIYCLDAFGSAHRKHASTYGVAKYIPAVCGFLVEKELKVFNNVDLPTPDIPQRVIVLPLIKSFNSSKSNPSLAEIKNNLYPSFS